MRYGLGKVISLVGSNFLEECTASLLLEPDDTVL